MLSRLSSWKWFSAPKIKEWAYQVNEEKKGWTGRQGTDQKDVCELSQRDVPLCKSNKEASWEVKQSSDMIRFLLQKDSHLAAGVRMDCRDQDKKLGGPLEAHGSNPGKKWHESELS